MTESTPRSLMWKERYRVAMLESDQTKLPPLLDDAIDGVLDQIEQTVTYDALEELNNALNSLRARRKVATCSGTGRGGNSDKPKAA